MTSIERVPQLPAVLVGFLMTVIVVLGTPRAAHAGHDLACLYINRTMPDCADPPDGVGVNPLCIEFGECSTPSNASAAINICLGVDSGDCPVVDPELDVDDSQFPPVVGVTIHQSVSEAGAGVVVDATAGNFPGASPTGHLLICVDTGYAVLEAGIADEFGNCEPGPH